MLPATALADDITVPARDVTRFTKRHQRIVRESVIHSIAVRVKESKSILRLSERKMTICKLMAWSGAVSLIIFVAQLELRLSMLSEGARPHQAVRDSQSLELNGAAGARRRSSCSSTLATRSSIATLGVVRTLEA